MKTASLSVMAVADTSAHAVEVLSALAQVSRLTVFRLLVKAGPGGMRASDIAAALEIPANTLSTHLRILTAAGLLTVRAAARERIYAVQFDAMRELVAYLLEDCCQGSPEVCTPLADLLAKPSCCGPEGKTNEAVSRSRRR